MNNMKINRLKIVNYKLFQNVTIEMKHYGQGHKRQTEKRAADNK